MKPDRPEAIRLPQIHWRWVVLLLLQGGLSLGLTSCDWLLTGSANDPTTADSVGDEATNETTGDAVSPTNGDTLPANPAAPDPTPTIPNFSTAHDYAHCPEYHYPADRWRCAGSQRHLRPQFG